MEVLPADLMTSRGVFAPLFTERVWRHIPVLLGGAILAPGKRTITSGLRVMGLGSVDIYRNHTKAATTCRKPM